ncbi:Dcp1p-Dcp2p decapping enzyme complex alpha subunit, partial [Podila humilis]
MITDSDNSKKTLRFLVFDLMVLNGAVVTQRSYSTRLGMMDQDILAVQSCKTHEVRAKEPFTIERKTMQRSYGLNIILSESKRHKHGGEGLIFVPVKRPYVPGLSTKLLKWKSHMTAQFQVKVTQSKERKPLYCIHTKQGAGSKFYDYVTPEPGLASEWHNTTPDGKTFEFWWDAQWPTQMFEKGYGLETRTGGWRFYRAREDKKEADEEAALQTSMKAHESSVSKEQKASESDSTESKTPPAVAAAPSSKNSSEPRMSSPITTSLNSSIHESSTALSSVPASTSSPAPSSSPVPSSSPGPSSDSASSAAIPPPATTSTSKNLLKLSQIPEHLQPIKSWMTVSPVPRVPHGERPAKATKLERWDRSETASPKGTSPRPTGSITRKSSLVTMDALPETIAGSVNLDTTAPSGRQTDQPLTTITVSSMSSIVPAQTTAAVLIKPIFMQPQAHLLQQDSQPQPVSQSQPPPPPPPQIPTPASTPIARSTSMILLPATSLNSFSLTTDSADSQAAPEKSSTDRHHSIGQFESAVILVGPHQLLSTADSASQAPSPVLGKRNVESSSGEDHADDLLTQKRKLSDAMQPSPRTESVVSVFGTLNLVSSLSPKVMSSQLQTAPLTDDAGTSRNGLSDPSQPPPNQRKVSMLSQEVLVVSEEREGGCKSEHKVEEDRSLMDMDVDDMSSANAQQIQLKMDEEIESGKRLMRSGAHTMKDGRPVPFHGFQDSAVSDHPIFVSDTTAAAATKVGPQCINVIPSIVLPIALTAAEHLAYSVPSDHEKRIAVATATAQAQQKLNLQRNRHLTKENKRQQDMAKFKKNSMVHKEKVQRIQEVVQLQASQRENQMQDRRAQPVRQTQQQARLNQSGDVTSARGAAQNSQRVQAQEVQRLAYQTRNAKATLKIESQDVSSNTNNGRDLSDATPTSTAPQHHGQTKQALQIHDQPLSQGTIPTQTHIQLAQQLREDSSELCLNDHSVEPMRSSRGSTPESKVYSVGELIPENHRRVISIDYNPYMSRSAGSVNVVEQYSDYQQDTGESGMGHSAIKRLDHVQHLEPNHKRSHSDVGIFYNPATTNVFCSQHISKPLTVLDQERDADCRTGIRPDQHVHSVSVQHMSAMPDERLQQYPATPAPTVREGTPVKKESKSTLQFILNEDNPSPESYAPPDLVEYSEGAPWSDPSQTNSLRPYPQSRNSTMSAHTGFQQSSPDKRPVHASIVADIQLQGMPPPSTSTRRQAVKKQKVVQDKGAEIQSLGNMDSHDHPSSHSHAHLGPPTSTADHQPIHRVPQERRQVPTLHHPQQFQPQAPYQHTPTQNIRTSPRIIQRSAHNSPQNTPSQICRPVNEAHETMYPRPGSRQFAGSEQSQVGLHIPRRSHPDLADELHHSMTHASSSPRRSQERPTHSRHGSLTKPMSMQEQVHAQGIGYNQRGGAHDSPGHQSGEVFMRPGHNDQGPPHGNLQHPISAVELQQQHLPRHH